MLLRKNIKLLTWFNFFTALRLYAPIAIIYFSRVTNSYALGASIFSVTMLVAAVLDVPTGMYSDILGRKRTVVVGSLFSVLSLIFYAIGISYWFLFVGAIFEGTSRAFYSGNNNALLHNMLSEEGLAHEYASYFGKLNAAFQMALAVSAISGGIIASFSFSLLMWLSVLPKVVCLLISLHFPDSRRQAQRTNNWDRHLREALSGIVHNRKLRLLTITSILGSTMGDTAYQFQAAFYNLVWPLWAVGIAKMLSNIFAASGFYFSGVIIKRFRPTKLLLLSDVYGNAVNLIALLFPTVISPILMSSVSGVYGVSATAQGMLSQREFTEEQRATMSSLSSFVGSLFYAVFAFAIGVIADKWGPVRSLIVIEILSLVIIWFHWRLFGTDKGN